MNVKQESIDVQSIAEPLVSEIAYTVSRLHADMYGTPQQNIPICHQVVVSDGGDEKVLLKNTYLLFLNI